MSLVERRALPLSSPEPRFVTVDPATLRLLDRARQIARSDASVLIEGESGTGKQILARRVHAASPRADRPLVAIDCAALPATLLERELFGLGPRAFESAQPRAMGPFERAHRSTLLLEQIGKLEPATQSSLARVLDERRVPPCNDAAPVPCDFRLIATTRRDLAAEVRAGRFRRDLYRRLVVAPLRVRPLREREIDVPRLLRHFLDRRARRGTAVPSFGREGLEALSQYAWPGNVRELQNLVERLVLTHGASAVELCDLKLGTYTDRGVEPPLWPATPPPTLRELERWWILTTLRRVAGNRTRAARELGISLQTLRTRIQSYAIDAPEAPTPGAEEAHERYATA